MDWYVENIEEPVRPIVKLLRENGINTTCSCGHEMYIECDIIPDGQWKHTHDILFNNGYRNYTIEIIHEVTDGWSRSFMVIKIKDKK